MPKRARFTSEDEIYHVLSKSNNRQNIFHEEENRAELKNLYPVSEILKSIQRLVENL